MDPAASMGPGGASARAAAVAERSHGHWIEGCVMHLNLYAAPPGSDDIYYHCVFLQAGEGERVVARSLVYVASFAGLLGVESVSPRVRLLLVREYPGLALAALSGRPTRGPERFEQRRWRAGRRGGGWGDLDEVDEDGDEEEQEDVWSEPELGLGRQGPVGVSAQEHLRFKNLLLGGLLRGGVGHVRDRVLGALARPFEPVRVLRDGPLVLDARPWVEVDRKAFLGTVLACQHVAFLRATATYRDLLAGFWPPPPVGSGVAAGAEGMISSGPATRAPPSSPDPSDSADSGDERRTRPRFRAPPVPPVDETAPRNPLDAAAPAARRRARRRLLEDGTHAVRKTRRGYRACTLRFEFRVGSRRHVFDDARWPLLRLFHVRDVLVRGHRLRLCTPRGFLAVAFRDDQCLVALREVFYALHHSLFSNFVGMYPLYDYLGPDLALWRQDYGSPPPRSVFFPGFPPTAVYSVPWRYEFEAETTADAVCHVRALGGLPDVLGGLWRRVPYESDDFLGPFFGGQVTGDLGSGERVCGCCDEPFALSRSPPMPSSGSVGRCRSPPADSLEDAYLERLVERHLDGADPSEWESREMCGFHVSWRWCEYCHVRRPVDGLGVGQGLMSDSDQREAHGLSSEDDDDDEDDRFWGGRRRRQRRREASDWGQRDQVHVYVGDVPLLRLRVPRLRQEVLRRCYPGAEHPFGAPDDEAAAAATRLDWYAATDFLRRLRRVSRSTYLIVRRLERGFCHVLENAVQRAGFSWVATRYDAELYVRLEAGREVEAGWPPAERAARAARRLEEAAQRALDLAWRRRFGFPFVAPRCEAVAGPGGVLVVSDEVLISGFVDDWPPSRRPDVRVIGHTPGWIATTGVFLAEAVARAYSRQDGGDYRESLYRHMAEFVLRLVAARHRTEFWVERWGPGRFPVAEHLGVLDATEMTGVRLPGGMVGIQSLDAPLTRHIHYRDYVETAFGLLRACLGLVWRGLRRRAAGLRDGVPRVGKGRDDRPSDDDREADGEEAGTGKYVPPWEEIDLFSEEEEEGREDDRGGARIDRQSEWHALECFSLWTGFPRGTTPSLREFYRWLADAQQDVMERYLPLFHLS